MAFPGEGTWLRQGAPGEGPRKPLPPARPRSHCAHARIYFKVWVPGPDAEMVLQSCSCDPRDAGTPWSLARWLGPRTSGSAHPVRPLPQDVRYRRPPRLPEGLQAASLQPGAGGESLGCSVPALRVRLDPTQQLRGTCLVFHRPLRHLCLASFRVHGHVSRVRRQVRSRDPFPPAPQPHNRCFCAFPSSVSGPPSRDERVFSLQPTRAR